MTPIDDAFYARRKTLIYGFLATESGGLDVGPQVKPLRESSR
jgi:hypothetical protein